MQHFTHSKKGNSIRLLSSGLGILQSYQNERYWCKDWNPYAET